MQQNVGIVEQYADALSGLNSPLLSEMAEQLRRSYQDIQAPDFDVLLESAKRIAKADELDKLKERLSNLVRPLDDLAAFMTFAALVEEDSYDKANFDENADIGYEKGWSFLEKKKAPEHWSSYRDEPAPKDQNP